MQNGNQTYSYDAFNRTVRVETVEGNYQEKHYDAEGLRAEMVENGELVKFLFAEREVVAETEADDNVIRYIRGYELISSDSEKAKTYYHYVADEQGSITHLVTGVKKVAEDTNIVASVPDTSSTIASIQSASMSTYKQGTSLEDRILNRYEYDAFGNTMYSDEKVQNRFRYTGQQCDSLTQQYYLRARYYNPIIARFTQEDTYHGDGLNLYSYCSNNPLMYYDPSGHAGQVCPDKYDLYRIYREKGLSVEKARDVADAYKKKYGDYDPKHEFDVKKESTSKPTGKPNNKNRKQPDNGGDGGSNLNPRTRLPRSNGHWSGDPGNSLWYSDIDAVNKITGGEGIPFVNGRPDFSKWSKGTIPFKDGVLNGTKSDFNKVYEAIKEKYKLTSNEQARQLLSNLRWPPHHLSNNTIILVPTDLHGNIPHIGSASDMRNNQ